MYNRSSSPINLKYIEYAPPQHTSQFEARITRVVGSPKLALVSGRVCFGISSIVPSSDCLRWSSANPPCSLGLAPPQQRQSPREVRYGATPMPGDTASSEFSERTTELVQWSAWSHRWNSELDPGKGANPLPDFVARAGGGCIHVLEQSYRGLSYLPY